jgi:hypothetical protein
MAQQRGRPRVAREPNERVPMSTRIRGDLFNKLAKAATRNDRPLGNEVEIRLEASFRDEDDAFFPEPLRHLARSLMGIYLVDGPAGVVRRLTGMRDPRTFELPDEAERKRRWQEMRDAIEQARWASPEAEDRYQRMEQKIDELRAMFRARADEAGDQDEAQRQRKSG